MFTVQAHFSFFIPQQARQEDSLKAQTISILFVRILHKTEYSAEHIAYAI